MRRRNSLRIRIANTQTHPGAVEFRRGTGIPDIQAEAPVVALQGKLEMEIAQLPSDDAAVFMSEYGITELSLNRMIGISYDLLDQQSFFTVGEDEVLPGQPAGMPQQLKQPAKSIQTGAWFRAGRGGGVSGFDRFRRNDRNQGEGKLRLKARNI